MSFKIPAISLGSSVQKRFTRDMSFDNNTTMPFGYCQPLMSQMLLPNSDIKVSTKQLVRLAPMPCPSFARMYLDTRVQFVPFADVCPYFEAMLSNQSYKGSNSTFIPQQLPVVTSSFLMYLLLCNHARFTCYRFDTNNANTGKLTPLSATELTTWQFQVRFYSLASGTSVSSVPTYMPKLLAERYMTTISPDGADYVIRCQGTQAGGSYDMLFCFRFHAAGRLLRSSLIGLGYSLDLADNTPISLLPILAFYKAWFDVYQVKRSRSWLNTRCFSLIKFIEEGYNFSIGLFSSSQGSISHLVDFIDTEFINTWYVDDEDYVSLHRAKPVVSPTGGPSSLTYISASGSPTTLKGTTSAQPVNNSQVSLISLKVLQRLTRFVNKDSIIGTKMSDWLRVHYGADVANSLYKDVYNVGRFRVNIDISDVFSTSDTAHGEGSSASGEYLGSYAGKSVNYGESGFKFHADKHGFLFAVAAIVPVSNYFQGNTPELYGINNDTLPNPDFDALGFEATPLGVIQSYNNYCSKDTVLTNKTFGFVPRYTGYKVKKNVVNGDMSRRAVRDDYSPYYLDKILTSASFEANKSSDGSFHFDVNINNIPTASEEWRYPCRYPWLGNFNRLFYNSGAIYSTTGPFDAELDDNFIVQSIFSVKVTDCLKPISESFDTFEEEADTSSKSVNAD